MKMLRLDISKLKSRLMDKITEESMLMFSEDNKSFNDLVGGGLSP